MIDLRALLNDRRYLTTFIISHNYVTVLHQNVTFPEIIEALEEHLGEDFKKPFVIVSSTFVYRDDSGILVEKELVDIVLEN